MYKLSSIFNIIHNVFGYLDKNLCTHVTRVAYLSLRYAQAAEMSPKDTEKLVLQAFLHDVGLLHEEQISVIYYSEDRTIREHSTYGYLYLHYYAKKLDPLVTLYHHVPYDKIPLEDGLSKNLANIIYLLDNVDFAITEAEASDVVVNKLQFIKDIISTRKNHYSKEIYQNYKNFFNAYVYKKAISEKAYQELHNFFDTITIDKAEYVSSIESITYFIESHSLYTAAHSTITAIISRDIAKALYLPEETQENLYLAGLLHDVGKVAVDKALLKKPGSITKDEFEQLKKHVMYTEKILTGHVPDEIFYPAIRHHENLKGTGYYNAINNLTIEDEVVRISDLLVALSEQRYYRNSLPVQVVADIIIDDYNSGNCSKEIFDVIVTRLDILYNKIKVLHTQNEERYHSIKEEYKKIFDSLTLG